MKVYDGKGYHFGIVSVTDQKGKSWERYLIFERTETEALNKRAEIYNQVRERYKHLNEIGLGYYIFTNWNEKND